MYMYIQFYTHLLVCVVNELLYLSSTELVLGLFQSWIMMMKINTI